MLLPSRFALSCAFLFSVLVVPGSTSGFAQDREGGTIGNGGSTIVDADGVPIEPGDFRYKQAPFALPGHYGPRILIREHQELASALDEVMAFVARRAGKASTKEFFKTDLDAYEIYPTETLSGADPLSLEEGVVAEPSGYTYEISRIDDVGKRRSRRIVEIKPSIFWKLSPRYQALELVHEMLHVDYPMGHEVIAPFIAKLNTLLTVRDRQLEEAKRPDPWKGTEISEEEFRASEMFQNLLAQYVAAPFFPTSRGPLPLQYVVSRRGGGVYITRPEWVAANDSNHVDMGSAVTLLHFKYYVTYWLDRGRGSPEAFQGNRFVDSLLKVSIHPGSGCFANEFLRVTGAGFSCSGSNSVFSEVRGDSGEPGSSGGVAFGGSGHRVSQVKLRDGELSLLGSLNTLELVDIQGVLSLTSRMHLKNVAFEGEVYLQYTSLPLFRDGPKSASIVGAARDGKPLLEIHGKGTEVKVRHHHVPFDFSGFGRLALSLPRTGEFAVKLKDTESFVRKYRADSGRD